MWSWRSKSLCWWKRNLGFNVFKIQGNTKAIKSLYDSTCYTLNNCSNLADSAQSLAIRNSCNRAFNTFTVGWSLTDWTIPRQCNIRSTPSVKVVSITANSMENAGQEPESSLAWPNFSLVKVSSAFACMWRWKEVAKLMSVWWIHFCGKSFRGQCVNGAKSLG